MKRITASLIAGTLALVGASAAQAQSGHDLFQQALVQERVEGNLEGAIQLYGRVVAEYPSDRALGAQALMQMGHSYELLRNPEASKVYQRVARDYGDQGEYADAARVRLTAIESGEALSEGIVIRQVWARAGGGSSVSPDGRYLAFVDWAAGLGGDTNLIGYADLAIFDAETGRSRVLTDSPPLDESDSWVVDAVWSPGGDRLAYSLQISDGTKYQYELHLIGADGTGDRTVVVNSEWGGFVPAAWSPDGEFILVVFHEEDRLYRIATISVDDGSVNVIKTLGRHSPAKPSLSPDGRYLVYDYLQSQGNTNHDIFVLAIDGSSESRLVTHPSDDDRPQWAPDGERILFRSDRSGRMALWAVRVSGGQVVSEPELVRPDFGRTVPIGFDREGALFYRTGNRMSDVHVAELDAGGTSIIGEPSPLTDRYVGTNSSATWSPDGNSVAYISYRGPGGYGSPHLVVRTLDSGQEREFPMLFDVSRFTRPLWSYDGKYIMMEGTDPTDGNDRKERVSYSLDLASDEFAREPYGRDFAARAGGQSRFASDRQTAGLRSAGRRIVEPRSPSYVDVSEQLISISDRVSLRYSNTGASPTALFNSLHIHSWALSPDGLRLAFASAEDSTRTDSLNSRVMRIMPIEGGEAVEVFRVAQKSEIIVTRWAPDGAALLLYVENPEDEDEDGVIWRVPLDGERPIRTDLSLTERQLALLDFHPDGSHIAFGTTEAWTEIWAMDGFPWTKDR